MDQLPNNLLDHVVQYSATNGKIVAAPLGYRMLTVSPSSASLESSSSTSSLESLDDNSENFCSNNNNTTSITKGSAASTTASSILTTNWFWGKSLQKRKQYSSSIGLDKESGLPLFTLQEVSFHDSIDDCWIVLYDRVYDITSFLNSHPGGDEIMLEYAGLDATLAFRGVGHSQDAEDSLKPYLLGILVESERIWIRFFNKKSSIP